MTDRDATNSHPASALGRDLVLSDKELQRMEAQCEASIGRVPPANAVLRDMLALLVEVRRLRSQEQRIRAAITGFSSVRVSVIQQAIDGEK